MGNNTEYKNAKLILSKSRIYCYLNTYFRPLNFLFEHEKVRPGFQFSKLKTLVLKNDRCYLLQIIKCWYISKPKIYKIRAFASLMNLAYIRQLRN